MKEKRQLKVNEYLRTFLFVKIRKNRIRFTVLRTFYFTKNCAQSSPLSKVFTIKKQNIIHRIKENCCSTNFQKKKKKIKLTFASVFSRWGRGGSKRLSGITPHSSIFLSIGVSRGLSPEPTLPPTPTWRGGGRTMGWGGGRSLTPHRDDCSTRGWTILCIGEWLSGRGPTAHCASGRGEGRGSSSCDYNGTSWRSVYHCRWLKKKKIEKSDYERFS